MGSLATTEKLQFAVVAKNLNTEKKIAVSSNGDWKNNHLLL